MYDKTELLGVKGSWREVVDDCRATVGMVFAVLVACNQVLMVTNTP